MRTVVITPAVLLLAACGPRAPQAPSARTDDFPMVPAEQLGPRVSGEVMVVPNARIKEQVKQSCRDRLAVDVKLCLGADGVPTSAAIAASSGIPAYDAQVQQAVLDWRYASQAAPVCTEVSFRYEQRSNVVTSNCAGVQPSPPPPPPPGSRTVAKKDAPTNVEPAALEAQRISGNRAIVPDDVTKTEIQRTCKARVVAPMKVCIDETGTPTVATLLRSTGFPAYDERLEREVLAWRYTPFFVDGKASRVCSAVTFVYLQKDADAGAHCASAAKD